MTTKISSVLKSILCLGFIALFGVQKPLADEFSDVARVQLIPGWQRDDGAYVAALRIDLKDGWKTYWRAPGENGIAPIFDWAGSQNLAQVGYVWPSPEMIEYAGTMTIGYRNQLILPILLKPINPTQPVTANLDLDFGVCLDICLPSRAQTNLTVAAGPPQNRQIIDQAIALKTIEAREAGLVSATCHFKPDGDDFVLTAQIRFNDPLLAPRLVIVETGSELIWASASDHATRGNAITIETDLQYYGEGSMMLDRSNLRFTFLSASTSIEVQGCTAG